MKLKWKQPLLSFCSSFLTQALKTSAATFKEQKRNQESSRVCITWLELKLACMQRTLTLSVSRLTTAAEGRPPAERSRRTWRGSCRLRAPPVNLWSCGRRPPVAWQIRLFRRPSCSWRGLASLEIRTKPSPTGQPPSSGTSCHFPPEPKVIAKIDFQLSYTFRPLMSVMDTND